jgi:hypothetical protein
VEESADLAQQIVMGRVPSRDGRSRDQRREEMRDRNRQGQRITSGLPESVDDGAQALKLRKMASEAIWHALNGLLVYDELTAREGGSDVMRTLLSPFEKVVGLL